MSPKHLWGNHLHHHVCTMQLLYHQTVSFLRQARPWKVWTQLSENSNGKQSKIPAFCHFLSSVLDGASTEMWFWTREPHFSCIIGGTDACTASLHWLRRGSYKIRNGKHSENHTALHRAQGLCFCHVLIWKWQQCQRRKWRSEFQRSPWDVFCLQSLGTLQGFLFIWCINPLWPMPLTWVQVAFRGSFNLVSFP